MRRYTIILTVFLQGMLNAQVLPNYGGERAGLSALTFLKNDINPRSLGMGGASAANSGDVYSLFTNPAALTQLRHNSFSMQNMFVGAGVNQSFVGGAFPNAKRNDVIGFSINGLNSGSIKERTEFMPQGTGREFSVVNMAFGLTYARKLSDQFSAGLSLKYIYENIAEFTAHTAAVDLSFLYQTDWRDLQFAVVVSNFSGNSALSSRDRLPVDFNRTPGIALDDNTLPILFSLGASARAYKNGQHSIHAAFQINHPNDNAENIRLGGEYDYSDVYFLRLGYKISVDGQQWPTFGFGVKAALGENTMYIDYGANPTDFVGMQHLIGLRFLLLNTGKKKS
ncbi:MAG: PorV/PorQ family protein [Cryomorphaceae bacterium]|nr:PorV/PorQ family protein [Cryomorphaceae bacterium]